MPATVTTQGDLAGARLQTVLDALAGMTKDDRPVTLDLSDAEIEDGAACATLTRALRQTAQALGGELIIVGCPQVLAHTLYRVGALGAGSIRLVEPRDEIGTAG